MIVEYDCIVCGTRVRRKRSPATIKSQPRFCSQRCNGAARRGSGTGSVPNFSFACQVCGKACDVYRSPSAVKPRFCSVQCIGVAQRRENNPAYTGGRYINEAGYVLVLIPDHPDADVRGYLYEHRWVMEQAIGRRLKPVEIVHHRNRIKHHNQIENLKLLPSQAAHMRLHHEEDSRV